jgi:transcription termination/antitermination protein NusG
MESNKQLVGKTSDSLNSIRNWYVAYTSPRAEKQVAKRLEMAGIEYYLPVREEFRQWSDRLKKIIVPVFPSYIFVYVNRVEYFSAINQSGMVKYVHFGGVPARINGKTIENIQKMLEFSPAIDLYDKMPDIGKRYRIPSGPLKGIEGMVLRMKGKTHFILEVDEWGKCIVIPYTVSLK